MRDPNATFHSQKGESNNGKGNTVQESNGQGTSTGALAGIAFGCTALLAVIVIITFLVSITPFLVKEKKIRTILYSAIKGMKRFKKCYF